MLLHLVFGVEPHRASYEGSACAQAKHLTQDQYAMNHPAGRIGKRLTLRVADVMVPLPQLPLVRPTVTVLDALAELSGKGHGCVLITSRASKPCVKHCLKTHMCRPLSRSTVRPACCPALAK